MGLNTDCPSCGNESSFHNGVCHECPECDYDWGRVEEECRIYLAQTDGVF